MINSLLTKITTFLDKDYLFASFLPALIFNALLSGTLVLVVGLSETFAWLAGVSASLKATLVVCWSIEIVVFGYVLNGLRGAILGFWAGTTRSWWTWGFRHLGEELQRRRFLRLRGQAAGLSPWREVFAKFSDAVETRYDVGRCRISLPEKSRWLLRAEMATADRTPEAVTLELQPIVQLYGKYLGDDLGDVYEAVKRRLDDRHAEENFHFQSETTILDRSFGSLQTVRASTLGNIIASYNLYPYKRYAMEAEVFWPRLRKVLPEEYTEFVQDQQILLDFSLAMATLSGIYAILGLIGGPWIWYRPSVWLPLGAAGLLCCLFFYRVAVQTAERFGDLVRSSFDLFRLDLMEALHRPHPATWQVERQQWKELSELTVYGVTSDFTLVEKKEAVL